MSIFVSYAADDISHVSALSKQNNDLGRKEKIKLWISYEKNRSKKNLEPGSNFRRKIIDAINKSNGAIIFVSNALLKSQFVLDEELPAIFLMKKNNPNYKIIPIFVEKTNLENFPELSSLQFSNTPNTALENIRGGQYRLVINNLLDDLKVKSNKMLIYSSIIGLLWFSILFIFK